MSITPLDRFIRASDSVISFEAQYRAREDTLDGLKIDYYKENLNKLWEAAQSSYDLCLDFLTTSEDTEPGEIEVSAAKFQATFDAFVECACSLDRKKLQFSPVSKSTDTPVKNPKPCDGQHNLTLPPCDVEMFEGDYLSWPAFRDLFTALYINSSRLTDIERLCHLLRKTSGDAKKIVSQCPLSDKGFQMAWQELKAAYENPRMLVNNQLKALFSLPVLEKESFTGLKDLQGGINSCLKALSEYEVPTENWDPILVLLCVQRIPDCTVTLWEQSIKNKFALSRWKDMNAFLTERIQTLECLRDIRETPQTKKSTTQNVKTHHAQPASNSHICVLCKHQSHFLRDCKRFKNLSVSERYSTIRKHHCCLNCLSRTHEVKNCTSAHSCSVCKKRHNTLLHRNSSSSDEANASSNTVTSSVVATPPTHSRSVESSAPTSNNNNAGPSNRQVFHVSDNRTVLLGTAMVNIRHQGMTYPARALIDPGSETSFISERLQNQLKITAHLTNAQVSGVNQTVTATSTKLCSIEIASPLDTSIILRTNALVIPNISGILPSFVLSDKLCRDLPNLPLADSQFFKSRPVDLLLGADLYPQIMLGEIRTHILGSLLAQNTIFGWIITGPVPSSSVQVFNTRVDFSEEDNLNSSLLRFWELEEAPKRKIMSPLDRMCEENYKATTRRGPDGRYIVTLPFKSDFPEKLSLGSSKQNVRAQFLRTEASLLRKPEIKKMYDDVVREYLVLDHMRPITETSSSISSCYLPHHPVIKLDRKTTKLRVVFNASNKTSNGLSLNDCLLVGPTLQADLVLLILRWRFFRFVFNCDITQMYRQIRLDQSHTPFQRILFRDSPTEEIKQYELQTVTFGVNCAPYLAIRSLLQLADDCESQYPLASQIIRKGMYVDDVLTGTHDVETALVARDQLKAALSSAGFNLRKWTSNDKTILVGFPPEHLVDEKLLVFVEASSSKTLGLQWNAHLDAFYFKVDPIAWRSKYTKREVLSTIAKLFDPVGWLGPVIVVAKMIMQRIWQDQINWDENLKVSTLAEWEKFVTSYHEVNSIQIPRWVHYEPESSVELHVFSDASEKAYAGVIYVRVETPRGKIYSHLLTCKTKVAPIKSVTLPRLELCGAVLAADLLKAVLCEIDIPLNQVYCWTDSTIVLSWLKKDPCTWAAFVANRVCKIQEIVGKHNWHHVRSEDNPADLGSRGVTPSILAQSSLWWNGPHWLREKSLLGI